MHCSHCSSLMAEVETQQDGRTEQTRFECPNCGRSQLVTQRMVVTNRENSAVSDSMLRRNQYWVEKFG
jgi:DNA-directed RNA polymerase subunit M/transcription elongation factor TFIIS